MNAATVSRTLSLIPERVTRSQSGSLFDAQAPGSCPHPERIVHLAQFLTWLGPLQPLTKEDLRLFGLLTPYGKPAIEALDDEVDAEGDLDLLLVEPAATAPIESEPALT
jgi:hypothetical protein